MSGYQDRLQGKDRLLRIRRIRNAAFLGLLALTIVLIGARVESEGASLKPFFLPINGIIEVALIMGLIATLVGLFLRNLEIKNVSKDNQRYLMAKYSMTRAMRTAGFAIGIAVVLLLAITPQAAATLFSDPPEVVSVRANGIETVTFPSPDPLGVTFVTQAIVSLTNGTGPVTVSLQKNNVTQKTERLNQTSRTAGITVETTIWASYANWALVFQNTGTGQVSIIFNLQRGVIPTFFSTVPFLLFVYGGAQVSWWFVLRPIRERTKVTALSAAPNLDLGERIYDGKTSIANPPPPAEMAYRAAAAPRSAPFVPPFPPPAAPSAAPATGPTAAPKAAVSKPSPRPAARPPDSPDTLVTKAGALVAAGAPEAAMAAYEEALRLDPGHVGALLGRAHCMVLLNRRPEALELYKRMLTKDAKNLAALRAYAGLLADERRWRECLEAVDDLLRTRPNESFALELKGDALTNLGRRPEALAAYEAALALDPSNENLRQKIDEVRVDVPGLLSRALVASASGNYPQALNLFDDILEIEPSNVNALIGKAVAYRRSGKPQEALNCLDLVLGVQANNASALLNRGNILLEEGDLDGALDAFDRLTQVYPADEEAWAAQGEVLVRMGRREDALRAYAEALKRSPGDEGIQRQILELEAARTGEAEILQDLTQIKGIGQARAKALVHAGFKTAEDFARASTKDLMAVRGVTRKMAEDLVGHFKDLVAQATAR